MKSFKSFLNEANNNMPRVSMGVHDEIFDRLEGSLAGKRRDPDKPFISSREREKKLKAAAALDDAQRDAFDDHRRAYTNAGGTDNALIQSAYAAVNQNPSEDNMSALVQAAHDHSMKTNPHYANAMKSIPAKHQLAVADQYFSHRIKPNLDVKKINRGQA